MQTAVYIMHASAAAQLALRGGAFVDLNARGAGSVGGVPVLISKFVAGDSSGGAIILLDAAQLVLALGDVSVGVSTQAAIEMSDAPTDPPTGSTLLVSLFQHNLVGVRVERFCNWALASPGAVAYVSGASYDSGS